MKLNWEDFPDMRYYVAEHLDKLPKNCVDRALISNLANETICINPHILRTFGPTIAILSKLFLDKYTHADNTLDNPMYDGYYKSIEERELDEKEKYQRDKDGRIWFTYPPEEVIAETKLPIDDIVEALCALINLGAIDLFEEKGLNENKIWYTFFHSAYYGMTMYSVQKEGAYCDGEEENNQETL